MTHSLTIDGPVKLKPSTSSKHLKWKLKNSLDEEICDLWIDTNHTYGNDPDIRKIKIEKNGKEMEIFSDPPDEDDDTTKHVTFLEDCWEPGDEITIKIDFDATFDDDEWISFSPTDEVGYVIMGPKGEVSVKSQVSMGNFSSSEKISIKKILRKNEDYALRILLKQIDHKSLLEKISSIESKKVI